MSTILALCGSLRAASMNAALLRATARLASPKIPRFPAQPSLPRPPQRKIDRSQALKKAILQAFR